MQENESFTAFDHAEHETACATSRISSFDLTQLDKGRTTAPVAALQDALAGVRAAAGVGEDEPGGMPWIDQAKADGDLSRTAKNVAGWLDQHGDGEVKLQAIGTELHASVKGVRAALDELATWAYVDLRPSIRTGTMRVKIMR